MKIIEEIAKEHLHLETLESRGSDSLDFSEQAVWSIRKALDEAYHAGLADAGDHVESLVMETKRIAQKTVREEIIAALDKQAINLFRMGGVHVRESVSLGEFAEMMRQGIV